ncbi:hypothetical protein IFM89_036446 [Coptis chinensis]|uniref:DYW domain-containing protein n=1 Tax=Coptis chinensis TaxID=261450 RepID=A0A835M1P8_9MAGN|nr:hypothetical protein IFM89_036446 [Coptis chinensis]
MEEFKNNREEGWGGVNVHKHGERQLLRRLVNALQCFQEMKSTGIEPDEVVFLAALTACSHARLLDQGLQLFDSIRHEYSIEPAVKHYTCMVDLYGRAGQLEEAFKFIESMPINTDFVVWGALFREAPRAKGYMPNTEWVLHNIEEEEKEDALGSHSEKLALAFGLISIPAEMAIRIVKNLRVCGDCHSLMKYVSMISRREIILRDIKRFHQFKNGRCSCEDYW